LRIREFNVLDTDFIIKLLNTQGWLQFIGDRNVRTDDQARNYLENGPLKSYAANGFGLWMTELKHDATPVGMCGLLKRDYLEHPDIGFAFMPEFSGKGYAYEAATATMSYAKNILKMPVVDAITLKENLNSINLLEKIGMKFQRSVRVPGDLDKLLLYSNYRP